MHPTHLSSDPEVLTPGPLVIIVATPGLTPKLPPGSATLLETGEHELHATELRIVERPLDRPTRLDHLRPRYSVSHFPFALHARHSRSICRIAVGYTIRCRNGLIAAM